MNQRSSKFTHSSAISEVDLRVDVLGVGVSVVNMPEAVRRAEDAIVQSRPGYLCVTGVHGVMEAQRNPEFRDTLNHSYLTVPDGMPLVWLGKLQGHKTMSRVYGPDLMTELCRLSAQRGYKQFLYGGREGIAQRLAEVLKERFPGLRIVGTFTPGFGPLSAAEKSDLVSQIDESRPDVLWVGLSTPKQERFMAEYIHKLGVPLMVGVGAAFDIHTGGIRDAPDWLKRAGLQWLHRLLQEPNRLWRRYLINNPRFVWKVSLELLGVPNRRDSRSRS